MSKVSEYEDNNGRKVDIGKYKKLLSGNHQNFVKIKWDNAPSSKEIIAKLITRFNEK
jgi:hypothetical protein